MLEVTMHDANIKKTKYRKLLCPIIFLAEAT